MWSSCPLLALEVLDISRDFTSPCCPVQRSVTIPKPKSNNSRKPFGTSKASISIWDGDKRGERCWTRARVLLPRQCWSPPSRKSYVFTTKATRVPAVSNFSRDNKPDHSTEIRAYIGDSLISGGRGGVLNYNKLLAVDDTSTQRTSNGRKEQENTSLHTTDASVRSDRRTTVPLEWPSRGFLWRMDAAELRTLLKPPA